MDAASKILLCTPAFILAGGQGRRLFPLTRDRAKPAVPFGGVHRLIDFTLSNCFNSGIRCIRILSQYRCESLHSYVGALNCRSALKNNCHQSVLCLCPLSGKSYRGTADAVFQNLSILENPGSELVVILSGDHVYRMDYRDLIRFHLDCGADVTISGVEWPADEASQFGVLEADFRGRVVRFEEKPKTPNRLCSNPSRSLVNMGVYVFNGRTLADVLRDDARRETGHDFGKDIIPILVQKNIVSVYNFTKASTRLGSYWRDVGTVDAYYRANMDLLLRPFLDPYEGVEWPLCTREAPPEREARNGSVVDSIIPRQGVFIGHESRVIHSVLSPGVRIQPSAEIRNSILLHNVRVGVGARIQRAILDENVSIADGVELGYDAGSDGSYGLVTDSGVLVIPANTHVASSQGFSFPHAQWTTEVIDESPFKGHRCEGSRLR